MAPTEGDVNTQELNVILKTLAKRGNEGTKWKAHTENVIFYILQQLSERLTLTSENRIVFQPYGSAAEDLKCIESYDLGDVDVVIFPNSENTMIYEELIEYLPEHPLHVRIIGVDHPVLHSCLVDDTDHVATSALKNFHPAIYGSSAPEIAELTTRAIKQIASQEEFSSILQSTSHLTNSAKSPAVTLNFAQPLGCLSEKPLKDQQDVSEIYTAEWEWLVHLLFRETGTRYTREHAEVVADITQVMNELGKTLKCKGLNSPSDSLPVLQECFWSDRGKNLRTRMLHAGSTLNETRKEKGIDLNITAKNNEEHSSIPEYCDEFEGKRKKENCITPENVDEKETGSFEDTESTSRQSTTRDSSENSDQSIENKNSKHVTESDCVNDEGKTKPNGHLSENPNVTKPEEQPLTGKFTSHNLTSNHRPYGNDKPVKTEKRETEKRIQDSFFDHLFGKLTEAKGHSNPSKEIKLKDAPPVRVGGFDFVPAFRSRGWPKVAREWINRKRKWPSPDVADNIVQEGFHLVVKAPKNGGNPDCDFRLSFAHAEYLLSQEMNDIQRECYRCLKKFHRAYLSTEPKSLVTFHLKYILLQTIEETGVEMWTESNRAECMMTLLRNLLEALTKKDLRHFFVRSYNMFSVDYINDPGILESLAIKAEQILENPLQFARELIQNQDSEIPMTLPKEENVSSTEPTVPRDINKGKGLASGETEDMSPKGNDGAQCKHTESTHQESSSNGNYRYHDLKDIYLTISKELTDMAKDDGETDFNLETLDPLERSLAEGLREIERLGVVRIEEFPRMFDICWDMAYYCVLLSTEQNMRRRMLDGIKAVVEICKYAFKQDDFAAGNEEGIIRRMLDPASENRFDLSTFLPAGSGTQFILRFFNSAEPMSSQPRKADMDGIPLD